MVIAAFSGSKPETVEPIERAEHAAAGWAMSSKSISLRNALMRDFDADFVGASVLGIGSSEILKQWVQWPALIDPAIAFLFFRRRRRLFRLLSRQKGREFGSYRSAALRIARLRKIGRNLNVNRMALETGFWRGVCLIDKPAFCMRTRGLIYCYTDWQERATISA